MPYNSVSEVPDNVPKAKRKQWMNVWNSIYGRTKDESRAFAGANAAIKLLIALEADQISKVLFDEQIDIIFKITNRKKKKYRTQRYGNSGNVPPMEGQIVSQGEPTQPYFTEDKKYMVRVRKHDDADKTRLSGFVPGGGNGEENCGNCAFYCADAGCYEPKVVLDTEVPDSAVDGYKDVKEGDWCEQHQSPADGGTLKVDGVPRFSKFVQITKVDEAKRLVGGVVTAEVIDKVGECCDYKTTKPYYEKWSEELSKATGGKNLGNLREMHGLSAVGAGKSIDFDDAAKTIYMTFKVVDDPAWKKVKEGVYTGFSHGGDYIRKWDRGIDSAKMYTARPTEVSLVDLPCLPEATFDFIRADGSHEVRKFAQGGEHVTKDQTGQQPDLRVVLGRLDKMEAAIKPMLDDAMKKTRAANLLGNFRKTEANKDNIAKAVSTTVEKVAARMGLKKDLYTLRAFAQVLQDLAYIRMSCEMEAQNEGDGSELPAALQTDLESLAESFLTMAQEEVGELVQSADSIGKSEGDGNMLKLSQADLEKAAKNIATHFAKMRKSVEEFNKGMGASIGEAHKILGVEEAVTLGDMKPRSNGDGHTLEGATSNEPHYSFKVYPLADGKLLKVTYKENTEEVVKMESVDPAQQPMTKEDMQKAIDTGIDAGLQQILKAMYGEEEVAEVLKAVKAKRPAAGSASGSASGSESGSVSGEESGSVSGTASTKKVTPGIGDRTQTPVILSNAGPVVRVMPVTKTEDNRMVDAVLGKTAATALTPEEVVKALSGDPQAALKLMRGATPTDVPATLYDTIGKVAGGRA